MPFLQSDMQHDHSLGFEHHDLPIAVGIKLDGQKGPFQNVSYEHWRTQFSPPNPAQQIDPHSRCWAQLGLQLF